MPSASYYPAVSSDNGYANNAGEFFSGGFASAYLEAGRYSGNNDRLWLRIPLADVPPNAYIAAASLALTAYASLSATTAIVRIDAVAADDPAAPTSATDCMSLATGAQYVDWTMGTMTDGTVYTTPDIAAVLQEVVDRPGYATGAHLLVLLTGGAGSTSAYRKFSALAYNAGAEKPRLDVSWQSMGRPPVGGLHLQMPKPAGYMPAAMAYAEPLHLQMPSPISGMIVRPASPGGIRLNFPSPSPVSIPRCSIDNPITNGVTSAAVVNLLQPGNATIAEAAHQITEYDEDDDERAVSVVYHVSNLLEYTGVGIGALWACALATWLRQYGDCEGGAILIHSLLLAAGVDPGRVRTAFGTMLASSFDVIEHAWVMYRRRTDEEWVPLDWTIRPTPYTGNIGQFPRQVDLAGTYTRISYILTEKAFGPVPDVARYIARLAANRSAGSLKLPLFTVSGATGNRATGRIALFAGQRGTTITVQGSTGALACAELPALEITGQASQTNFAQGRLVIPFLCAAGSTGAIGAITLPSLSAVGLCGMPAKGAARLPMLAIVATATTEALSAAALRLPVFRIRGTAKTGQLASGECGLPRLTIVGHAAQGPMANGAVRLPYLSIVAHASTASEADGVADLPLLQIHAHAVGDTSFDDQLQYKPERWT